ncbi:MAG: DNA-3-methyladenine glycosylase [Planctomycetota bacterium]
MILPISFYQRDTIAIAKDLLGAYLVHDSKQGRTVGRIVETEAYLFDGDPACHAHKGKTKRNATMFGPPGHAYLYFIYGMYYCFNVVTAPEGVGEAALIRALEPVEGIPLMEKRRHAKESQNLCNGPGKLTMAMSLTLQLNGAPLFKGPLTIWSRDSYGGEKENFEINASKRIGIMLAANLPLRFYIKNNSFVSGAKK